jgi:hypothetical protein
MATAITTTAVQRESAEDGGGAFSDTGGLMT